MFIANENNVMELKDVGDCIPQFGCDITISIDGSTTITGISYIDSNTANIIGTTACYRGKDESGKEENFVKYKVQLKQFIKRLIDANINRVKYVDYEEPFIGYVESSKVLMSLRTSVPELIEENEPLYNGFVFSEINNQLWKRLWLEPIPVPSGTDNQKRAVKDKIIGIIPSMKICEQDEIDATCMGYVTTRSRLSNGGLELKRNKPSKPFKYNIAFIGVEEGGHVGEEVMLDELSNTIESAKVPKRVIENGIKIVELNGYGLFEKHVYTNMSDDDKLLILGFNNNKYINVIIENNVSWMIDNYEKIYALVWRVSRKSR